jgi:hypothetical protein
LKPGRMITFIMTAASAAKRSPVIMLGYQPTLPNPLCSRCLNLKENESLGLHARAPSSPFGFFQESIEKSEDEFLILARQPLDALKA